MLKAVYGAVTSAKPVIHYMALAILVVGGFLKSPAGQAVLAQYPTLSAVVGIVAILTPIATLYANPKPKSTGDQK